MGKDGAPGVPGGNGGLAGDLHQQGTGAAHLFFQQPGRGVLTDGLERVGANELGKLRRLMRRSLAYGAHLIELHRNASAGTLPGSFCSGQAGADDAEGGCHVLLIIARGVCAQVEQLAKKSEKQIPRGLKPARNDRCE